MPYSVPFLKVNFEGHFGSSTTNIAENWVAGLHVTKNGGLIGGTTELTNFLTAIRAPAITYHSSAIAAAGTNTFLDAVSGAYIGTDGKYALGSLQSTTRVPLTTSTPGSSSGTAPWSQSMCITLRSTLLRGAASHGRIYWPAVGMSITPTTGVFPNANVISLSTAAKTFLDAVNVQAATAFGSGANVGLVSAKGTGFQSPVVKVGIGQRIDSMESRERNIAEAHVFSNLVVSTTLLEQVDDDFRAAMRDAFPDADLN